MSSAVATKHSRAFLIPLIVGVILLVGGVIGNVINQRAVWADVSTAPLHTQPVHVFTGFSFNSSLLPALLPNQIVQSVCQVAMVVGFVVLVAAIAYRIGKTRTERRLA